MEDDQVDIKIINLKQEIASNKAWIDQVSKSEAVHANTVIRLNQEFKEFKSLIEGKIECLEECEDLRDKQMNVLKGFIETYLMVNINTEGGDHGGKIGVLKIPKAKK